MVAPARRGSGDRRRPHTAAAEHRNAVARSDGTGVHGRADARHDPAPEEARSFRPDRRDLGALARRDQGELGECSDAQRG